MTARVFIDGAAGTTGLEIRDRLAARRDVALVQLDEAHRRDPTARTAALNEADVVVLCLPDEAAREAVAMAGNSTARIIDASSAHRTAPGWTYGFPELEPGRRAAVAASRRVSNPGCYPTGFLALVRPLVRAGLLMPDLALTVHAVSGYSGGGKAMIEAFERPPAAGITAWQTYGLTLAHKHLAEMRAHAGLSRAPIFSPAVVRTYRGMIVEVPLPLDQVAGPAAAIGEALADSYADSPIVRVVPAATSAGLAALPIEHAAGTDRLDLFVFVNEEAGQARLVAALDNLGKGAAGAAVQTLNLLVGAPETEGLRL